MLISRKALIYSFLIAIFSGCISPFSTKTSAQEIEPPTPPQEWTLRLGGGIGYVSYRDLGTAPFHFRGVALQPDAGLQYSTLLWRYRLGLHSSIGILEDAPYPNLNFNAFDVNVNIQAVVLRRLTCHNEFSLWAGGGLANFLDVTINPDYENAAVGVSEFAGILLSTRAEWQSHSRWSFHGELSLMPIAFIMRPGYSYIDNYTAYQPVLAAQFSNYEWNFKGVAALATDIGVDFRMGSGNQLGFAYRWHFHNSGKSGQWNFDHYSHLLVVTLNVKLN